MHGLSPRQSPGYIGESFTRANLNLSDSSLSSPRRASSYLGGLSDTAALAGDDIGSSIAPVPSRVSTLIIMMYRISLSIADWGLRIDQEIRNPKSAIRNS